MARQESHVVPEVERRRVVTAKRRFSLIGASKPIFRSTRGSKLETKIRPRRVFVCEGILMDQDGDIKALGKEGGCKW
jgi:hypothetical protein